MSCHPDSAFLVIEISIAALQSFRALARCGSFTAAARDLGRAQSVVSRHVASMERHLKRTLVLRGHRTVRLTAEGDLYLETVSRVLDELDHGARRLASASGSRPTVKIMAMPTLAARWLVPRLTQLHLARIDVDIELATSSWDADFRKERFDLAIHYGDGSWPGAQLLMHDSLVPAIAPRLLAGQRISRIEDLVVFPWLHGSLRSSKWPQWLAAHGAGQLASGRNMKFQDTEATLTAAVAGLGIAMGHPVLIENDVREGRLVEAWPQQAPLTAGYHLMRSPKAASNSAALAVSDWLINETKCYRTAGIASL